MTIDDLASKVLGVPVIVTDPGAIPTLLATIKPVTRRESGGRTVRILKLRFGLEDGPNRTLEEVGREFRVTRERIRQIEKIALCQLRHPSRSNLLRASCELLPTPRPKTECPTCGGKKEPRSTQCQGCFFASRRLEIVCPGLEGRPCGKVRLIPPSDRRNHSSHFCRPCYLASRRKTRPCAICDEAITRPKSRFREEVAVHHGACGAARMRQVRRQGRGKNP